MKRLAAIFIGAAYARSLSYCGSGHGVNECLDVGVFLGDYRRNFSCFDDDQHYEFRRPFRLSAGDS